MRHIVVSVRSRLEIELEIGLEIDVKLEAVL
jgi:hypothetical protein